MLVLLLFAFISGLVTILAPCIWPLLPIIMSSSIAGTGHRRPLGITLGIMLSFGTLTLMISYLISIFKLDPNILRLIAVVVIGFLGLTMLVPPLTALFERGVSKLSGMFSQNPASPNTGFWGGFIAGLTLGIVWSPCAGPILASIATLAATGKVSFEIVLVTIAYVTGIGIPLFAFAYGSQKLILKSRQLSPYTARIQQFFGVIMILTAIAIFTNYDKAIQLKLLDLFPQFGQTLNSFEGNKAITTELNKLKNYQPTTADEGGLFNQNYPAPEFIGITNWLNPNQPLTIASLKGKVVLIDFWTYTCINCLRTLPYVTAWYDKYHDQGLVVIGVHTPEFAFEKESKNVAAAIKQYNIHYPVAQDNNYDTWNAYQNQYWPAEYLIDAKGIVRRTHFGEGNYDESEKAIQALLQEAGQTVNTNLAATSIIDQSPTGEISPETYIGAQRMQYLYPSHRTTTGGQNFQLQSEIPLNSFSFGGPWTISDQFSSALTNAKLNYHFQAKKVFLVMAPPESGSTQVKVFLDGQPIPDNLAGADVKQGVVKVDSDRLYELIDLKTGIETHLLSLEFPDGGTQVYAFTFGG